MFKNKKILVMNKKDYEMVVEEISKNNKETIEINEKALKTLLRKEDINIKIGESVIKDGIIEISNCPKKGFYTCYNIEGFLDEYSKKVNGMIQNVLSVDLEYINSKDKTICRRPIESLPIVGKLFK